MSEMDYQRMIIAYHGCGAATVKNVLRNGRKLDPNENKRAIPWIGD